MKYIFSILLFFGLSFGFHDKTEKSSMQYISIGMFDDKIGLSLIGYTSNLNLDEMNSLFFGGGTSIIFHTIGGGLKHHYFKQNGFSVNSVFSFNRLFLNNQHSGTGEINTVSTSLSLEYDLSNWIQIKLGYVGVVDGEEDNYELWGFPFLNLNFRFD